MAGTKEKASKGVNNKGAKVDPASMTEEEMVEAALRAGEQAAAEELAAERDAKEDELIELRHQIRDLEDSLEEAQSQAQAAKDRHLRLQAEWENYRRRTAEQRLAERELAAEKLVCNLLPVIDDLERAVGHVSSAAGDNELVAQLASGVDAVKNKFVDTLCKEGAEVIDPAGEPFDPLKHQAVGRVEDGTVYDETVRDVYQRGWKMGGKVLRPAVVTITYGGAKRPLPDDTSKTATEDSSSAKKTSETAPADSTETSN